MPYFIWDWNGTILDDIDVCIESMNILLNRHSMPQLADRTQYRSKLQFPIIKYYTNLGFNLDTHPFEGLAAEFLSIYQPLSMNCGLVHNVENVLAKIKSKGFHQIIISASEDSILKCQIGNLKLDHYFDGIYGLDNIFARSKLAIAERWKNEYSITSSDLMVIGDTYHDFELANQLSCDCRIYGNGHEDIRKRGLEDRYIFNTMDELHCLIA